MQLKHLIPPEGQRSLTRRILRHVVATDQYLRSTAKELPKNRLDVEATRRLIKQELARRGETL